MKMRIQQLVDSVLLHYQSRSLSLPMVYIVITLYINFLCRTSLPPRATARYSFFLSTVINFSLFLFLTRIKHPPVPLHHVKPFHLFTQTSRSPLAPALLVSCLLLPITAVLLFTVHNSFLIIVFSYLTLVALFLLIFGFYYLVFRTLYLLLDRIYIRIYW